LSQCVLDAASNWRSFVTALRVFETHANVPEREHQPAEGKDGAEEEGAMAEKLLSLNWGLLFIRGLFDTKT